MDEHERARLTDLVTGGDADALQQLIVEYHPVLRRKLCAQTHESFRTLVDVEDVLQQAYIAAFQSIENCHFEGPGGLYKWLERIALNDLRDAERALERKKRDIRRQVALGDLSKGRAGRLRESLVTLAGQLAFPECEILLGDMNNDARVNGGDIDPFFQCLAGQCP